MIAKLWLCGVVLCGIVLYDSLVYREIVGVVWCVVGFGVVQ